MRRLPLITAVALLVLSPAVALAAARPASAVIGGTPGTIPSLVEINYSDIANEAWLCSGTIVSPNVVLTAGHCATGNAATYSVYTQVQTQSKPGTGTSGSQFNTVSAVIPAPGYDATADYVNDAALLVLAKPTTTPPITLATTEPVGGTSAAIYGWGDTTPTSGDGIASTTGATVIQSNAAGAAYWTTEWAPSDMSALDPNSIVALGDGDSGGPLVVNGVEVGINDRTGGVDAPSIFTRVDQLDGWIQSEIAANAPNAPSVSAVHVERDVVATRSSRSTRAPSPPCCQEAFVAGQHVVAALLHVHLRARLLVEHVGHQAGRCVLAGDAHREDRQPVLRARARHQPARAGDGRRAGVPLAGRSVRRRGPGEPHELAPPSLADAHPLANLAPALRRGVGRFTAG